MLLANLYAKMTHPNARKALLAFGDQAVASLANFLTGVVVGRMLAKESFGHYMLGFSVLTLISTIQVSVIARPLTVYGPRLKGPAHARYHGSVLIHQLGLSALGTITLLLASTVCQLAAGPVELASVLAAIAIVLPILHLRDFVRALSFARLRMVTALLLDLCVGGAQLGGVFLLAYSGLLTASRAYLASGAASAMVIVPWLLWSRHEFAPAMGRIRLDWARNWKLGKWVLASRLTAHTSWYALPWTLYVFHGPAEAGLYFACSVISYFAAPLITGMANFTLPVVSHAFARGGQAELRRLVKTLSGAAALPVVLGFVLILFFGGKIVELAYGPGYAGYGYLVSVLALRPLITSFLIPTDSAIFAIEKPNVIFKSEVIRALIALIPGLALVYWYGVDGVAVTMLIMVLAGAVYRFVEFWFVLKAPRIT